MRSPKTPLRMCVGCGEMKPKKELLRVVKTAEGEILIDRTGKQNGRGAYICNDVKCLKSAQKARRFERCFSVKMPDEVFSALEKELL